VILLTRKALSLCSRKAPRCLRTTTEGKRWDDQLRVDSPRR